MALASLLVGAAFYLLPLLPGTAAQSCWRNTTCSSITETAFPGVWESNIYAPASRTVSPKSILSLATGQVISAWPGAAHLATNGSKLVFDFGIEVGGLVTLKYSVSGSGDGAVGLAFTEAKNWIGEFSDSSNGNFKGPDGAIYSNFTEPGEVLYVMPDEKLRGGFRYLTLFLISPAASVDITDISLEIGFQPTWSNLRAYQGYFHCSDELLNKIWYSGAYTLQTNSVPVNTGRKAKPFLSVGWANNGTLGSGETIIVDGAKRDRAVWPGDMGVAVPSTFVSTGDLDSVKNALQVMYDYQNSDGSFPEAGPPLLQQGSDTYHMWSMIGTYNYVLYTDDTAFLHQNWAKYLSAMNYIYSKVTYQSGLLNVTGLRDWARWQTGFNETQAQMVLYRTLVTGADLATWVNDTTGLHDTWLQRAAALKNATIKYCYDPDFGSFRDNATATTLYPQDANSQAILFGVIEATSPEAQAISLRLHRNWGQYGAETPELPGNISPFISSFEIQAHMMAGQTSRALQLIRLAWGWYLNHPNGTGSTVIEGYRTDGSFGYRAERGYSNDYSYVSHAHGWSSGPTSALTELVLGLQITGRAGRTWRFWPQWGDLDTAEGGFVTKLGKFRASWQRWGEAYEATVTTPKCSSGRLILPVFFHGQKPRVTIDGKVVDADWYQDVGVADSLYVDVAGGTHKIMVG